MKLSNIAEGMLLLTFFWIAWIEAFRLIGNPNLGWKKEILIYVLFNVSGIMAYLGWSRILGK